MSTFTTQQQAALGLLITPMTPCFNGTHTDCINLKHFPEVRTYIKGQDNLELVTSQLTFKLSWVNANGVSGLLSAVCLC